MAMLYLYVWAGLDRRDNRDFVATIDVTTGSPCFGRVIAEAEVPTSGNEPHHVGLNADASVSGLLLKTV
jgi:selenium-binding protein 1